jgi:hypothetical protein
MPLPLGLASPLPLVPLAPPLPPAPPLPGPLVADPLARELFVVLGVTGRDGGRLGVMAGLEEIVVDPCSTNDVSIVLVIPTFSISSFTP